MSFPKLFFLKLAFLNLGYDATIKEAIFVILWPISFKKSLEVSIIKRHIFYKVSFYTIFYKVLA